MPTGGNKTADGAFSPSGDLCDFSSVFVLEKYGRNKDNGCVLNEASNERVFMASVQSFPSANADRGSTRTSND